MSSSPRGSICSDSTVSSPDSECGEPFTAPKLKHVRFSFPVTVHVLDEPDPAAAGGSGDTKKKRWLDRIRSRSHSLSQLGHAGGDTPAAGRLGGALFGPRLFAHLGDSEVAVDGGMSRRRKASGGKGAHPPSHAAAAPACPTVVDVDDEDELQHCEETSQSPTSGRFSYYHRRYMESMDDDEDAD